MQIIKHIHDTARTLPVSTPPTQVGVLPVPRLEHRKRQSMTLVGSIVRIWRKRVLNWPVSSGKRNKVRTGRSFVSYFSAASSMPRDALSSPYWALARPILRTKALLFRKVEDVFGETEALV